MLIKLSYKAMLIKEMEQRQDRLMLQFGEHRCFPRYAKAKLANMLDDVMPDGSIRVLAFLLQRAFPF